MYILYRLCLAPVLVVLLAWAGVGQASASDPWIATVRILKDQRESGSGVYLGPGRAITAAHLTNTAATMGVRIAGRDLPATILRQGVYEEVDLSLLSFDEPKLPRELALPRMQLCEAPASPGDRVIIVDAQVATQSHIVSPQVLPVSMRRFSTLINAARTGASGSGVFDPSRKCLLGIMSRQITFQTSDGIKDFKYFVPAADIRAFVEVAAPK